MSNRVIRWSDIGSPTEPGTYTLSGVGEVEVSQEDIAEAGELGGDPRVEIVETTTFQDKTRTYILGHFLPA